MKGLASYDGSGKPRAPGKADYSARILGHYCLAARSLLTAGAVILTLTKLT